MMTRALSPSEAGRLPDMDGVVLVDIRPATAFAQGHPEGALNVPYSQQGLSARVRVAAPGAAAVVLVAEDERHALAAEQQLAVGGWTVHGFGRADDEWWHEAGRGWRTLPERPVASLRGATDLTVLDVREPMEWETGHVPGAILVPLGQIREALDRIPRDREVVVICESGVRSATGASILFEEGYAMVSHAPEGTAGARRSGQELEYPRPAGKELA